MNKVTQKYIMWNNQNCSNFGRKCVCSWRTQWLIVRSWWANIPGSWSGYTSGLSRTPNRSSKTTSKLLACHTVRDMMDNFTNNSTFPPKVDMQLFGTELRIQYMTILSCGGRSGLSHSEFVWLMLLTDRGIKYFWKLGRWACLLSLSHIIMIQHQ